MSSENSRAPEPKGRGAILQALFERKKREREAMLHGVGVSGQEPKAPRGRAALLEKIRMKSLAPVGGEPAAATPTVEHVTQSLAAVELEEAPQVTHYRGASGKPIDLSVNYIRLKVQPGQGVFEYEVAFSPDVDAKNNRIRLVNQILEGASRAKVFDGGACLYLPNNARGAQAQFQAKMPDDATDVTVTITYKRQKSLGDRECLHLYNVLFKRIMHLLLYVQIGHNYFDPQHRELIPQRKLEVYPGFVVAVDELEDGLMLCLDTQHRVLRTENAYELLNELKCVSSPAHFKEAALRNLLGSLVLTKYNNKSYIIDDILWDMTPRDTFPTSDGREISFMEYYKMMYKITIADPSQPLLLHRRRLKKNTPPELEGRMVCLIPELCTLTGLTDAMRNDFRVMKDVALHTRVTPQQRALALRTYLRNVRSNERVQQILGDWGLRLADDNLPLSGRQLEMEQIVFGSQQMRPAGAGADWGRTMTNCEVTGPMDLLNWVLFYTSQDAKMAQEFAAHMTRLAPSLGYHIGAPRMERLPNDNTATYVSAIRTKIDTSVQVCGAPPKPVDLENLSAQAAVFICPSMRSDRYAVIKKLCSTDVPVASQVINSRTLSRPDKARSIILKIALQINCKLGGTLWTVKFPFRGWMICGIDVYHGGVNQPSVCGFVSSLNESITRWYSTATFQGQELGDFYPRAFAKGLEQFRNQSGAYPSKVVVIRDGAGDGQLDYVKRYEIKQFEDVLKRFELDIPICFVVVQKRISSRLFHRAPSGQLQNPPPGTVLDHTITRRHLYDFFMVPQSVREGTVNPTHYIVLHDTCRLKPDHVQRLCYKLCHLYYNWPGTIRVPAPCQYAHKLAAMVGQQLKTEPSPALADRLWYL
ncbi:hypothetical protein D910_07182 [Dendroctonus ponderosae]|uniref:Piwi domain-containing protein n=1 Tax=Dendroctonus ponderosae TaxID=77166 RepID=U4U9U5_DENPD|nr:hypothetical protein D910_07182 [Dendroctonus ponderosae]KAH1003202.1 hypothetical protein HUJ05_011138 [Dendroctonus ponderosae]